MKSFCEIQQFWIIIGFAVCFFGFATSFVTRPHKSWNDLEHRLSKQHRSYAAKTIGDAQNDDIEHSEHFPRDDYLDHERFPPPRFRMTFRSYPSDHTPAQSSDILTTSHRTARTVVAKQERIWEHGVIPYTISRVFNETQRALFRAAMNHWENYTCIKFVERKPDLHPDYIIFTIKNCGCCSHVGKHVKGGQAISIGQDCDKFGIVVHELGHVIGFWHEHTRPDRDDHIYIQKDNIIKNQENNFKVQSGEDVDSMGMPYDYESIMHYGRNTFSKSTYLDTIIPKQITEEGRPEIGQRNRLSRGDIAQANLLYKCPQCGRTFQNEQDTFMSPTFELADAYPTKSVEKCEWRVTTFTGEKIRFSIGNLSIFESENCETDYLELRDGYWDKSPVIGRYCGNATEIKGETMSNRLLIRYVNLHRNEGYRGFQASYSSFCGGDLLTGTENRLISPNYPLNYLSSRDCTWTLRAPKGFHVVLKFDHFQLENSKSCANDYLEIQNGDSKNIYCGNDMPPLTRSENEILTVRFSSDVSVERMGFSAVFVNDIDECAQNKHDCEHRCINTLGGYKCVCEVGFKLGSDGKSCIDSCGGLIELEDNTGTIASPQYPEDYPNNNDCVWELVAPENRQIFLNFTNFSLEGGTQHLDCNYDNVTVFSRVDDLLKHLGTFCGSTLPPKIVSDKNILRVEFHSDKSIQRGGFSAYYFTDLDECLTDNGGCEHFCENTIGSFTCSCRHGYILNKDGHTCDESDCKFELIRPYGVIKSKDYPENYPPNSDCVWHISVLAGQRIRLIFHDINIEFHQECVYDYLAIYDGPSPFSSSFGKFCGRTKPYQITSTTNELYFNFKSDNTSQHPGFMVYYTAICGGYLRATNYTQHFYSHAKYGMRNYKRNMDCTWTIQSDPDYSVQLTFDAFEVEHTENCNFDYVEIYDYSGPTTKYFGKFCGNSIPPNITSISDSLVVRFRTDNDLNLKGFAISFTEVETDEDYETIMPETPDFVTPFPGYQKSIYLPDWTDNTGG